MDNMEDTSQQTASPPVAAPMVRPVANRVISGSAVAVANKLGVSSTLVRVAWVLLAFSGIGIPLYALAWLLIPGEGESQSIGAHWMARLGTSQGWIGVILVVIALSVLTPTLPFVDGGILIPTILLAGGILLYQQNVNRTYATKSARRAEFAPPPMPVAPRPPKAPPSPLGQIAIGATVIALGVLALIDRATPAVDAAPRHYLALAVTILGLGVLVGTFYGRARWLIPFGLLLVPATAGAGIVEYENVARNETLRPTTFAELETAYELGVGQLIIDLTDLPWDGETVNLDASVGVGRLELLVPPGVAVDARTEVGIGASLNPSGDQGGLGVESDFYVGSAADGTVVTNLDVGIGEIDVVGSDVVSEDELFDPGDFTIAPVTGDLLGDSYAAAGNSDITLDLSNLELEAERSVSLYAESGDILVTLPEGISYSIVANAQEIIVLGEARSGTVITEFQAPGQATLRIDATSIDGTITIEEGSRS